ncbi:MAG TPA: fluoride efflux transporter CrcB [Longimicrobiales bacterium]|nr:fluoride efflux transporter CrcB [Longimicrobiales bacterium]
MQIILAIAAGGALGAVARYGLGGWVHGWAGSQFPWGTLVINVLGSLVLGVSVRLLEGLPADAAWRAFLAIGLAGGFTTFSTFGYEALALLQGGRTGGALGYMLASVVLGVGAVLAGFLAAAWLLHWRG